jgi:ferritin-like metal-binding protein YciE
MTASQRDLDTIDRHIAEAEEEIRRQRELVEQLRTGGRSMIAEEAEQLLSKMNDALEEMKEHRRVIIENSE